MSRKRKLVLIVLPSIVALGVIGGVASLQIFERVPSACGVCHAVKPYVESYQVSGNVDKAHADAEETVVCSDCHKSSISDKINELVVQINGDYPDPLEEVMNIPNMKDICLSCHPTEEIEYATRLYALDPHYSDHFGQMDCSLCHKVHLDRPRSNYCRDTCHEEEALEDA